MLDLVPFTGSRRVVTDCDCHAGFVAQRLEVQFPGTLPISVAASTISADQQPCGTTVVPPPIQAPPSSNALHGELRGFMRHAHVHHRPVQGDVISPIWNGFALTQVRKIVNRDLIGLARGQPPAPRIFKGSDELFLLGVYRYYRVARSPECFDLPADITKLRIPIGMLWPLPRLYVGLQGISPVCQAPADGHTADGMSRSVQLIGYGPRRLAGPLQRTHRIPGSGLF